MRRESGYAIWCSEASATMRGQYPPGTSCLSRRCSRASSSLLRQLGRQLGSHPFSMQYAKEDGVRPATPIILAASGDALFSGFHRFFQTILPKTAAQPATQPTFSSASYTASCACTVSPSGPSKKNADFVRSSRGLSLAVSKPMFAKKYFVFQHFLSLQEHL